MSTLSMLAICSARTTRGDVPRSRKGSTVLLQPRERPGDYSQPARINERHGTHVEHEPVAWPAECLDRQLELWFRLHVEVPRQPQHDLAILVRQRTAKT